MRSLNLKPQTNLNRIAVLTYDTAAAAVAMLIALWLPLGDVVPRLMETEPLFLFSVVGGYAVVAVYVYIAFGQHKATWRYTSITELVTLLRSATATVFLCVPIAFLATRAEDIPRKSVILVWLIHVGILTAPRLLSRLAFRSTVKNYAEANAFRRRIPAILVGAGANAQKFVRALQGELNPVYQIFGVVSADETLPKAWNTAEDLRAIPLLGALSQFPQIIKQVVHDGVNVRHLILSDDAISPAIIRSILPTSSDNAMTLLRVPQAGQAHPLQADSQVVPLSLQDVLPRVSVTEMPTQIKADLLKGRRVLITGAGGSIGSELARQVASAGPAKLGLLEKSEFSLFSIDQDLESEYPGVSRETILCDVRDGNSIDRWLAQFQPEIVFHAAALKHVQMVEAHPLEGILTNVDGTRNIADACSKHGVSAMVLVSSDKAVNPASLMGATKRLSEAYCQALDLKSGTPGFGSTRYITVRFGNVLWSNGSVVTRFRRQLAEGLPLTVTHPEVMRYFITIDEAVDLIFRACAAGLRSDANRGTISVLNMGAPVRILDLAHTMTMLAGKRPDIDVPIQYIGLRPGEKLSEDLVHQTETLVPSYEAGILLASPRPSDVHFLRRDIDTLVGYARDGDLASALRILQTSVPDYQPAKPFVSTLKTEAQKA